MLPKPFRNSIIIAADAWISSAESRPPGESFLNNILIWCPQTISVSLLASPSPWGETAALFPFKTQSPPQSSLSHSLHSQLWLEDRASLVLSHGPLPFLWGLYVPTPALWICLLCMAAADLRYHTRHYRSQTSDLCCKWLPCGAGEKKKTKEIFRDRGYSTAGKQAPVFQTKKHDCSESGWWFSGNLNNNVYPYFS